MESHNPRNGKVIETLGDYCPYMKDKPLKINMEKVEQWQSKGAIATLAVVKLLKRIKHGKLSVGEVKKKGAKAPALVEEAAKLPFDEPVASPGIVGEPEIIPSDDLTESTGEL